MTWDPNEQIPSVQVSDAEKIKSITALIWLIDILHLSACHILAR